MRSPNNQNTQSGFTLVELSIVLVIIGLIVGGIVTGREIIQGAMIRAQIGQFQQYNAAVNAFRLKYDSLPGDSTKSILGVPVAQGSGGYNGTPPNVVGNGLINSCQDDTASLSTHPPNGFIAFGCENAMFFTLLSLSGLVPERFAKTDNATAFKNGITTDFDEYIPRAKIHDNWLRVYAWKNENYFHIMGIDGMLSSIYGTTNALNTIKPIDAFSIDSKLDDGMPASGSVQAIDSSDITVGNGNLSMYLDSGPSIRCRDIAGRYNVTSPSTSLCQLRV